MTMIFEKWMPPPVRRGRPFTLKEEKRKRVLAIYDLDICRNGGFKCHLTEKDLDKLILFAVDKKILEGK